MKLEDPDGATPLNPADLVGLIPNLATQDDLNEAEMQNIVGAERWLRANTRFHQQLLTIQGLKRLHQKMFEDTWEWAGDFRTRETNFGIDWPRIRVEVQQLCGDFNHRVELVPENWPKLAVEFHHRLVTVHPFPNGNGRHARLAANVLLESNDQPRLPWGGGTLMKASEKRTEYIAALHSADDGEFGPLMAFATSG